MIINVCKYLIFGAKEEMDHFFDLAQRAGYIEFIGLSHKKSLELTDEIKALLAAIKIAKKHSVHPHEAPQDIQDPLTIASTLVRLQADIEQVHEEERIAASEIARVAIFGDFSKKELSDLERDGKRVFQYFCMKSDQARETTLPPEVLYIGTEYDLDYFVAINKERMRYPKMIEMIVDAPVGELRERLFVLQEKKGRLEIELRRYANALPFLERGLAEFLNEYHLRLVKHDAAYPMGDALFMIEAWVPKTRVQGLESLVSELGITAERIAIEPTDRIPTYMENKGVAKMGEDLVHIYDTPAHTDKDPSSWVMVFFSIFFAMIVADAGYGLIYLAIALTLKYKFPKLEGSAKRFVKLFIIISTCCIAWGILTASFFGLTIGPDNPFKRTSFIHALAVKKAEYHREVKDEAYEEWVHDYPAIETAEDGHDFLVKASKIHEGKMKYEALDSFYDNILMECSLLIGIIHLSLSFLRYLSRTWSGLGWIVFMIGGYLYFPSIIHATTMANFLGFVSKETAHTIGLQLVYGGVAAAFIAALFQKGWGAFHELMNGIQVFSDVLSYLRLYALALAGMIMANTFNEMGSNLGIFGGALIIVAGHLTNISLSTMGGLIHSLRLNFLEWYHYSFEGGGRLLKPLRLRRSK